ncbi:2,3-diaminopropionate biosynthesis protein SbnB [Streptomyces sp. YIM 98790]|uniref:2,3-diaminopropionate biosynthesis protein SbnB n=1 Tax=Streptomyces sp. YIM 98790 TaxID=2689077 RepID=UPI00140E26C4|nr:2,3-diaminopropionate biosynthesis protein SbnB [Streptomyces sp. YIM 98790]
MFDFVIVPGPAVRSVLDTGRPEILALVEDTYRAHGRGETVNPPSCFLRFPGKPEARIIALPAHLTGDGGQAALAGIKWVSGFPANTAAGLPRASAVLILNDYGTGHPVACLEAAGISAARTGASAAVAARALRPRGHRDTRIGVVGAGVIARAVCDYLVAADCLPDRFVVHDLDEASGRALTAHLAAAHGQRASFAPDPGSALECETVVFATTATTPYVHAPFKPGQLVLHISLRDLAPEVILQADNILDDVDHCLTAGTSPHLAEQRTGRRDFVTGTLAGVLDGSVRPAGDRPVVFSPFGLGVLDIAVGAHVLGRARQAGTTVTVPDFFGETRRWPGHHHPQGPGTAGEEEREEEQGPPARGGSR